MHSAKAAFLCAGWNLYSLRKNPRFYLSLLLGFLLCWLLTDKTMAISHMYLTNIQFLEPFVWCYADEESILFSALVMMLMFSSFPRLDAPASYLIFRTKRSIWLIGQIITVFMLTLGYSLMILLSSMAMCIGSNVSVANHWSETATMLSFAPGSFGSHQRHAHNRETHYAVWLRDTDLFPAVSVCIADGDDSVGVYRALQPQNGHHGDTDRPFCRIHTDA